MPKEMTFSPKWLLNTDSTGKSYGIWLRQGKKKTTFICTACNVELSCANGGWNNIKNHAEMSKHVQSVNDTLELELFSSSNTPKLPSINIRTTGSSNISTSSLATTGATTNRSSLIQIKNNSDRTWTHTEKVMRAECYWTMATAQLGFSYAASQNIPQLFALMFPDSRIAADLAKKDCQVSYVMVHGTAQFFVHELVKDVLGAPAYSLVFDENTIVGGPKQLDVHIRYWSEYKHGITTRYWRSIVYTNGTSEIIGRYLIDLLKVDGLDLCKLFQLGELITSRDNTNVNKPIEAMLEKEVRSDRETQTGFAVGKGLVTIGSCPLHAIQNAFMNGFTASKWQIEDILYDFSFFFAQSSARSQDYLKVTETIDEGFDRFLKQFVVPRWIEIGSIIERIIRQWPILIDYFITYLPKVNKTIATNDRWRRIKDLLERKQIFVLFHFFQYLYKHPFWKRLVWLQKQKIIVHILYEECTDFLRNVLQCFVKDDLLINKTGKQLLTVQFDVQLNQKLESKIEIGDSTRLALNELSANDRNVFFKDVRDIYIMITRELLRLLPLGNDFLRHLQFMHPLIRQQESARTSLMIVARDLPQMLSGNDIDELHAEWRMYENENIPDEWYEQVNVTSESPQTTRYYSVDHYWKHVLSIKNSSGNVKFVVLGKLVKSLLSLSHGNSDIESDLSENEMFVTDDRSSLNIATINGLRATKEGVRFYGAGKVHEVPVSKALVDSIDLAYTRYSTDQEKTQKIIKDKEALNASVQLLKENELRLAENEQKLIDEQKSLQNELDNASKMLDEANYRLQAAITAKNFGDIKTAHLLIESVSKKMGFLRTQLRRNSDYLSEIRKKLRYE
ncbi:unnamed protein product [Rotaria magnacalcarata]|uniref:Uncharacterized protein n=2 Tax=Rotaria magnacalcarata TaxID=392030 RepID=A0A815QQU7_9BILA|nr:unnamed protein product [Rotaria magnacalcarata]CAF1466706.1 unnamed protein product [Rotaria magnacalcarata]CAF2100756.1 unnamed protein product [Rotaria magnacalcarata]CAF3789295.1 unnamed protein product [Rotaria magnacalcarata]